VVGVVVDAQVQVEPGARDLVPLLGMEVDDVDEIGECSPDVDTGRTGSEAVIEHQGDAVDTHVR